MRLFILSDLSSIHTKRWVSSLSERGIHIFLFGLRRDDSDFYTIFENVTIFNTTHTNQLKNRTANGSLEKLKYLTVLKVLKKKIKDFQPDILHAHYASSYGLLGALSCFKPYIISIWGSDVYEFPNVSFIHKFILKYSFKKADKLLSTSLIMAKEARKYTDKPISITPFGVDVSLLKKGIRLNRDNKEIIIGNVKTLSPKYGIDVLIQSFKIVLEKNPNLDLFLEIIGEGEEKDNLIQLCQKLNIAKRVRFLGKIENYLLPAYYNSFLVSVSVLNSESFGVVAVEAMACECPVVVSDADGFTEVVVNNETGIIVPKKNVDATAEAIQQFIDNPKLRDKMGKEGRKRVEKLYNWDDNVEQMMVIYRTILY
ncbi:MAG: glycosyltransferase family 4 protein [Tannerellaceae bacterium]|jgi:glycosyltransferase involved in cell wall biosynthesis|nr:glycosyltransferase family 4 protein [Tannerellaceae bacterium]